MGSGVIRCRGVVRGRVQGVWYRQGCKEAAQAAGVSGWVRNRPDGTVEAVLEGDEPAVAEMLAWMGLGPPLAVVDGLDHEAEEVRGERGFTVR